MKVGVEGIPLFGDRTGVGQYQKRLLEAAAMLSDDVDFEIIRQLMPHRKIKDWPIKPGPHLKYRVVRWLPPIIYYQTFKRLDWMLPYDLVARRKYDALLFFNFVVFPSRKKTKSIVVIHDLSFIHHPEFTQSKNLPYMLRFVPKSVKRADHIIAVSENTKKDIVNYYKVPPSRITVITPAVDHQMFKPASGEAVQAVKSKFGLNKPYILSLATIEPRKNLLGVLQAFEKLPEDIKQRYSLVLAGGQGWSDGEILKKYNALSKEYSVIKTGYVDEEDLPALMSGASVFVYPSFFEGFGIPPLEAMACGVPVITANNSSLPEVVGEAAIKIKAEDTNQLARELKDVLTDEKLADSLRTEGKKQAAKFSWEFSAQRLLELLRSI